MNIKHISDTARWMAYIRAVESERPDALFRDPYARQLAGTFGEAVARDIGSVEMIANSIAVRTAVLDRLIVDMVARLEVDLILNIGSGLDTRPWRLNLPPDLQWLDVDLPALLDHKAAVLPMHLAKCRYQAVGADILNPGQRAAVLAEFPSAQRMLVVTEGLLVYLRPAQVQALAKDLHDRTACQWWLTDLVGPRALHMLRQVWAVKLRAAEFRFAPVDSVEFFGSLGWREHSFHSSQEEARRLNRAARVPWISRLALMLSSASFREEYRRLSGVALLARDSDHGPPLEDARQ
jgi:methyltransferase (TIGR00027 family)